MALQWAPRYLWAENSLARKTNWAVPSRARKPWASWMSIFTAQIPQRRRNKVGVSLAASAPAIEKALCKASVKLKKWSLSKV